jgi:hypothetical protein
MFARSEIEASEALECFARAIGTEPTYEHWNNCRIDWVNAYVSIKPQAKGNSADAAFKRFKTRLTESFGIEAPKAQSEAATKKAAERAKKAAELEQRFAQYSDADLTGMLRKAYEDQAKNPTNKSAVLGEIERAVKQRTKAQADNNRDALKATRERLFKLARECTDPIRIEAASDVLDPAYEITVQ